MSKTKTAHDLMKNLLWTTQPKDAFKTLFHISQLNSENDNELSKKDIYNFIEHLFYFFADVEEMDTKNSDEHNSANSDKQ